MVLLLDVVCMYKQVVNNHGPAKPQRTGLAASSTSPLVLSKESLAGEGGVSVVGVEEVHVEHIQHHQQGPSGTSGVTILVSGKGIGSPQKKANGAGGVQPCMEASFSSNDDGSSADTKSSPEHTLLNPSPLIIDADAEIEGDGELTPTNLGLSDILASLNLSWDYVTSLQERFIEKEKAMGHERKHSMGANSSSGCSEEGSTFKEIFGPIKYEDWMAPLASPETLSEISSLSSRASFLIPKDQSPLLKIKGGRNGASGPGNSTSLHRGKNGKMNGLNGATLGGSNNGLNGGSHSRSLSCTYPEVGGSGGVQGEVPTISSSVLQFISNGASGGEDSGSKCYLDVGDHHHAIPPRDLYIEVTNGGVLPTGSSSPQGDHHLEDDAMTPVIGDLNGSYVELVVGSDGQRIERGASNGNGSSSGEGKRVSFNLRRKYASKDSGCSVGDLSIPMTPCRYDPIYPVFSHQEEYGVPTYNSPHYTYTGHSPQESPTEMFPGGLAPSADSSAAAKFSFPPSASSTSTTGNNGGSSSPGESPHPPSSVSAVVSSSASPQLGIMSSSAATSSDPGSSASGSTTTFIQIADLEAHLAQFHAHQQHHQQFHQDPSDNSSENGNHHH